MSELNSVHRSIIAKRVADKTIALERQLDAALGCYGDLLSTLAEARRDAGLSAVVGHDAVFGRTPAVGQAIVNARGGVVSIHHGLAAVQRKLGIVMGPPEEKGTDQPEFVPRAVRIEREVA